MHFSEQPFLKDFDRFISYICERPNLPLTNDKGVLKGTDAFALNERMTSFQTPFVTSKHHLKVFSLINTFFYIAKFAEFVFVQTNVKGINNALAIREKRIQEYDALTDDEKYFFLLEAFWCHIDWDEAYECRSFYFIKFLEDITQKSAGQKVTLGDRELKRDGEMMPPPYNFLFEIFKAFGFVELTWDDNLLNRPKRFQFPYKDITLLPLGEIMLSVLTQERPQTEWHRSEYGLNLWDFFHDSDEEDEEEDQQPKGNFEDAFLPYFEGLKIGKHIIAHPVNEPNDRPFVGGNYYLKVSLNKKLYRTIVIGGSHTFDDLHQAIQEAFDFDDDHLYVFFMDNTAWSRSGESYWSPMNEDGLMADEFKIGEVGLFEGKNFLYIFDFGDEWRFNITVELIKTEEKERKKPKIIESVGKNPSQYGEEEEDDD